MWTPAVSSGVIGPNGSGKTTLFNVISGVYRPATGTVHYRGRDLTGLSSDVVARHGIARTFQNLKIFRRLTVLENVMGAQTGSAGVSFLQAVLPHPRLERGRRRRALDNPGAGRPRGPPRGAGPGAPHSASNGAWSLRGQWRGSRI